MENYLKKFVKNGEQVNKHRNRPAQIYNREV